MLFFAVPGLLGKRRCIFGAMRELSPYRRLRCLALCGMRVGREGGACGLGGGVSERKMVPTSVVVLSWGCVNSAAKNVHEGAINAQQKAEKA